MTDPEISAVFREAVRQINHLDVTLRSAISAATYGGYAEDGLGHMTAKERRECLDILSLGVQRLSEHCRSVAWEAEESIRSGNGFRIRTTERYCR